MFSIEFFVAGSVQPRIGRSTPMKRYVIELTDDLSCIYEDIARMNRKKVEECLSIVLEKVIRTMINSPNQDTTTNQR